MLRTVVALPVGNHGGSGPIKIIAMETTLNPTVIDYGRSTPQAILATLFCNCGGLILRVAIRHAPFRPASTD